MQQPSYDIIIPSFVRYDPNLKELSKLLLGEICFLSVKTGYCFATNKYFADLYNSTERTIINCINNLKDNFYITCIYEKNPDNKNKDMRKIYVTGEKKFMGEKNFTRTGEKNFIENINKNININNNSEMEKISEYDWINDD